MELNKDDDCDRFYQELQKFFDVDDHQSLMEDEIDWKSKRISNPEEIHEWSINVINEKSDPNILSSPFPFR